MGIIITQESTMKKIMFLAAMGAAAILSGCAAASSAASTATNAVTDASDCTVSSTDNSATATTKGGSVTFTQTETGYTMTYGGALSSLEPKEFDMQVGKEQLLDMANKYCEDNK